jgi:Cu2+-exporting ATPase/Cu+-exporting ATPase
MTEHIYKVKGMHCASCVSLIQNKVSKLPGIDSVSVGLSTEKAKIAFSGTPLPLEKLNSTISSFGYSLEDTAKTAAEMGMSQSEHDHMNMGSGDSEKKAAFELKFIVPMVVFSFVMMLWDVLQRSGIVPPMSETIYEVTHHLMPIFATIVLFGIGRRYIRATWVFLRTGVASMDTLVGISTIVAFIYSFAVTAFEKPLSGFIDVTSNYYDVVIVVIGLIALGQFLEARAKRKTNEALTKLAELSSKVALVERNGEEIEIPIPKIHLTSTF